jgi:hypothetical protein
MAECSSRAGLSWSHHNFSTSSPGQVPYGLKYVRRRAEIVFRQPLSVMAGLDPAISHRTMCVGRQITESSPVMTKNGLGPGFSPSRLLFLAPLGSNPGMTSPLETTRGADETANAMTDVWLKQFGA